MPALDAQSGVGAGGKRGYTAGRLSVSEGVVHNADQSFPLLRPGEEPPQPRLRFQGDPQWHEESDPVLVETCSCAGCDV